MKILVINGPNLNMLGIREKNIYGTQDYKALVEFCEKAGADNGVEITCFQSNHEGDIVDKIQWAYGGGSFVQCGRKGRIPQDFLCKKCLRGNFLRLWF